MIDRLMSGMNNEICHRHYHHIIIMVIIPSHYSPSPSCTVNGIGREGEGVEIVTWGRVRDTPPPLSPTLGELKSYSSVVEVVVGR